MSGASWLVFALVVPVAAATAWIVAKNTAEPLRRGDADDGLARLAARVERLEKAAETARPTAVRKERAAHPRDAASIEGAAAEIASPATAPSVAPPTIEPAKGFPPGGELKEHQHLAVGIASEPGSAEHGAALRRICEHLVKSAGPPPSENELLWGTSVLDREARRERVTPDEAEFVAAMLLDLPPNHAARPGLARAVAGGWADDPRLGGFLDRVPANSDPDVHGSVLRILDDEHPSAVFSAYVLRLVREERDPAVLSDALDMDIVEAAATAENAARCAQAVEARVLDGSLDADLRSEAGLAIAVACLRAPPTGVEMLNCLAGKETDAKVADRYRAAAKALGDGNATLKSLERIFE